MSIRSTLPFHVLTSAARKASSSAIILKKYAFVTIVVVFGYNYS